ncbi:fatty-acid amide hydrolase 2-B-like isoform X2 [Rhodnius prolixus]
MQTVNPIINGIVQDRFEDALNQAKLVDEMIQANPDPNYWETTKPLLGVPLTVKECIAVSGMSHNVGRTIPEQRIAKKDAEAVANFRSAGAIPIAVTNTPELCCFWESYNRRTGLTKNPYDTRRVAGGSSGGEGALLAAGGSAFGLGSDGLGSSRLPAHFCGIFAHKPSPNIISGDGHIPTNFQKEWDDYLTNAPLSRHAEDLPLMLSVAAPQTSKLLNLEQPVDFSKLKVYYYIDDRHHFPNLLHPDIRKAVRKSASHFEKFGVEPKKVYIRHFQSTLMTLISIMLRMGASHNIFQRSDDAEDFSKWDVLREMLLNIFGLGKYHIYSVMYGTGKIINDLLPQSYEDHMRKVKQEIANCLEELLENVGVLILPAFPEVAPLHFQMYYKWTNVVYLTLSNLVGLPSTVCPVGLNEDGLPFGVQIIASRNQDRLTLAVARELEKAFGGWIPPQMENSQKKLR